METTTATPTEIAELIVKDDESISQQNNDDSPILIQLKNDLRTVIEKMNEVCQLNNSMLGKISELVAENNKLYDEVEEQKIELAELNQYGRRENVEICNIPENIDAKKLEDHVIAVMKSIDVKVSSYNIVAAHRTGKRLPSRPRNVIVRFVNRKHAFSLLKNKKKLKNNNNYKNYYIIENLCPFNKRIFNKLYKLKKEEEIHTVWSFNGAVYAKVDENDEPTQIRHLEDIDELFEGSNYGDDRDASGAETTVSAERNSDTQHQDGNTNSSTGGSNFVVTPSIQTRAQRRRLSDIAEETNIRTPIEPLVIRQIKV